MLDNGADGTESSQFDWNESDDIDHMLVSVLSTLIVLFTYLKRYYRKVEAMRWAHLVMKHVISKNVAKAPRFIFEILIDAQLVLHNSYSML